MQLWLVSPILKYFLTFNGEIIVEININKKHKVLCNLHFNASYFMMAKAG